MPIEKIPPKKQGSTLRLLELAVPVFSFGGVLLSWVFSDWGLSIDIRYFAVGCVIASFALAYLAWIRPHKDIVALTTPIYAIIFFIVPSDMAVTIVLELLYAVSLTILLVRLKFRFGAAVQPGTTDGKILKEPLKTYCKSVHGLVTGTSPEAAHSAAVVFIRFAQGDYRQAEQAATAAMAQLEHADPPQILLAMAFDIVREQALILEESADQPEQFIEFSPTDAGFLAKPLPPKDRLNARFEVSLDNALLLIYAAAWNMSVRDQPLLLTGQSFALQISAP